MRKLKSYLVILAKKSSSTAYWKLILLKKKIIIFKMKFYEYNKDKIINLICVLN